MNSNALKNNAGDLSDLQTVEGTNYPIGSMQSRAVARVMLEQRKAAEAAAAEQELIWNLIAEPVAKWERGPMLWLTEYTKTEDTHALAKGTPFRAPFPKQEHLLTVMDYLVDEKKNQGSLAIIKSREMMASWTVMGMITWHCQFHDTFWLCQTGKVDKVAELIDYARILYRNQDSWLQRKNPIVVDNSLELRWQNGGRVLGLPSGADQVRMYHSHGYFQDESAFLPEAQEAHDAVRPVIKTFIGVSTDELGWFHDMCAFSED